MAGLGPVPNPTWPGLWVRTAGLTFYLFSKSPSPILLNKYPCPQYKAQAQPEPDPEWEKLYQITTKILNTNKIYQMAVIYLFQKGHRIYKPFPFHGPPKIAQIGIFGLKKGLPSDNPGPRHMNLFAMNTIHLTLEFLCLRFSIFVFRCADNGNVLKSM
jgi:hypothetical protein